LVIYKIENKINGKIYIGQTTKSIESRFLSHSKGDMVIGRAIKKYGIQSFKISVIDTATDKKVLNEKEKYWIAKLNSLTPNGYNVSIGGTGGNLGDLVNKKIKNAMQSEEVRKKIIEANTGRKQSKETVMKRISKVVGRKNTEETKAKMRHPHKKMQDTSKMKKPKTEEHKKNIGLASKGRKNPKLAEFNRSRTGQKHSDETRKKMSETRKKMSESKKQFMKREVL
jgi:hypothetical protein